MNKKLTRFLSLILAVLMVFSLCACSAEEEVEVIKYASDAPDGKVEIIERFNAVLADAKAGTPAVSYSLNQDAGDCECDNEYLKAAFKTIADKITKEKFSMDTKYGDSTIDILPVMGSDKAGELELTDVRSAIITDNAADKTYTLTIKINPETNPEQDNSVYGKLFKITKDSDILQEFDNISHLITAESYDAAYGIGTITATIDKETDSLVKLDLARNVNVTTEITGQGTLSSIGTVPMSFNYSSTASYALDWDNPETEAVEA